MRKKIVIMTTVPMSLATLVKGQAKYLSQFYDVILITSNSPANHQIESYEGVKIEAINMTRKITPARDLGALFKIISLLYQEKPDALYTFTPKAGLLGMIAGFFSRVSVRIHNVVGMPLMEARGLKYRLLTLIEKLTYRFATHLFCNSFGLKDFMSQELTSKPVTVVAQGSINGVDTSFFENAFDQVEQQRIRETYSIQKNDFVITFVGRIVKDKGINELVEAFKHLSIEYAYLKLLLVGDYEEHLNPIKSENKKLIEADSSIISVGFQSDIREFLAITDLFVLPSYREGLPNSLIEAGSFGVPLLATNINGCNEIVEDGKTGILVEKKSELSLRNGIKKMLDDEALYFLIKNNVRNRIIQRYEQKYFWEKLKCEFERVI